MARSLLTRWLKSARPARKPARRVQPQLVMLESREVPAVLFVNSLADAIVPDADLTLREAMTAVNAGNTSSLSVTEKTMVAGTLGSGDTISILPGGTITLSGTQLPAMAKSVTIISIGNNLTLDANKLSRHFSFTTGSTVSTLSGLTLLNGNSTSNAGSTFLDNGAELTIRDCSFRGNSATTDGGAILSRSFTGGKLTIERSTFLDNDAATGGSGSGGAIWTRTDTSIDTTTFDGNTSNAVNGGAIVFGTADRSRIVRNSTFSGNFAKGSGGAIAVELADGTVHIQNCTIVGNTAGTGDGGGIARINGTAIIEIASSIVSGNIALLNANEDLATPGIIAAKFSAIGTAAGVSVYVPDATSTALLGQNLLLNPLQNNGGHGETFLPAFGSPVRDAGSNPAGLTVDGRGLPRILNAAIDIGAVESSDFVVRSTADSGKGSLRQQVLDANLVAGLDTITFDATFNTPQTITLTSGQIVIASAMNLTGPGADLLSVSGNSISRVFRVDEGTAAQVPVTISGFTIRDGRAGDGGGIYLRDEALTLQSVALIENDAVNGTTNAGGGLLIESGSATIRDSLIADNSATYGGGIAIHGPGSLTLLGSTIAGNYALRGGGIDSFSGFLSPITIRNSTIVGNSAPDTGGLNLLSSAIEIIESSIVSNNAGSNPNQGQDLFTNSGIIQVNKSALGSTLGSAIAGANNLIGQNLRLRSLAANGGPTRSIAFEGDSPLRNAGSNFTDLQADQRGQPRNNAGVDIGAFELQLLVTNAAQSGPGSLRNALDEANRVAGLDTIRLDNVFGGVAKTITLTSGELTIRDAVTVVGPGAKLLTISGNNVSRVLYTADAPADTAIDLIGITITQGYTAEGGGGIFAEDESLSLIDCVVSGNTAGDAGGGIYFRETGTLSLLRTTVDRNTAESRGGGIYFYDEGYFEILDSTITRNTATSGSGGGLYFLGLVNGDNSLVLRNSTISGNSAGEYGGGVYLLGEGIGYYDGIFVDNCTITGNSSGVAGGGFANLDSGIELYISNTIISGNTAPAGADLYSETPVELGHSALGSTNGFTVDFAFGNLLPGTDLKLGLLADNGGPTLTHLPAIDSPLRNAGDYNSNQATDQRGLPRSDGVGHSDIGSVQVQVSKVVSIVRNGPATTTASTVSWTVTLLDSVTGVSGANFTFAPAFGPTINSVTGSGNTYIVTANTAADGPLTLNFHNAIGLSRTPTNLPFASESYLVNKLAPQLVSIDLFDTSLTDADVGLGKFNITATFSEPMNTGITPNISFPVENPAGSLVFASGQWLDSQNYRATYNVNDLNISLANIDVLTSGARDLVGALAPPSTSANSFSIDTRNPVAVVFTRNNPTSTNANAVSWTVMFSEPITGLTAANFSVFNGGLTGNPAITGVSGSGAVYIVNASTGGGEGSLTLAVDNGFGVTDASGNVLAGTPLFGGTYDIDHVSPAAMQLTPSSLVLSDANVGPNGFTVSAKFNEVMDQTVMPSVSFPTEFPASLTYSGGVWLDARTWQAKFNVADLGVTQNDIDLVISGGKDVVGNLQAPINAVDLFDIDTQNAVIASITSPSPNGVYTAGQTVEINVNFSEPIALSGFVIVDLNTGLVRDISGPQSGTTLSFTHTFVAGETTSDLNVSLLTFVSGSSIKDAVGNLTSLTLPASNLANNSQISIGTAPNVTGLIVNDGALQRSRLTKIVANISSPTTAAMLAGITLTRTTGSPIVVDAANGLIASVAGNSITLTFANLSTAGLDNGSLADGRWRLNIPVLGYTSGLNDPNLRRLFGDFDASGQVDGTDFGVFGGSFGATGSGNAADFDNNGLVDGNDFAEFGGRFGVTL